MEFIEANIARYYELKTQESAIKKELKELNPIIKKQAKNKVGKYEVKGYVVHISQSVKTVVLGPILQDFIQEQIEARQGSEEAMPFTEEELTMLNSCIDLEPIANEEAVILAITKDLFDAQEFDDQCTATTITTKLQIKKPKVKAEV